MRISVEYAHASLGAFDLAELNKSVSLANAVAQHLTGKGHTVGTIVLVDDKKVARAEVPARTTEFLKLLDELGLAPDDSVSESTLREWLPQLEGLLPAKQQKRLRRDADYLRTFGSLPCSVDIAIWHALRLGLLGVGPTDPADLVVSILGDSTREFEELARKNFLDSISGVTERIVTIYYPEFPEVPADLPRLIDQLDAALKEAEPCPVS